MSAKDLEIKIGIISPSRSTRDLIKRQVEGSGLADVSIEVDEYVTLNSRIVRRIAELEPDIVLIDLERREEGLESLRVLNSVLPSLWLFATGAGNDSEMILETMRAGAREYVDNPVTEVALSQALARYLSEIQRRQGAAVSGQLIGVTSAKGGSGTTSVALNLAGALGALPATRTAVVDLNRPVGDAAACLDLKYQFSIADALEAAGRLDGVLLQTFMSRSEGFSILPGEKDFSPGRVPPLEAVSKVLLVLAQTYTHTVVDLPSNVERERIEMFADLGGELMLITTPEVPSIWKTDRLLRFLRSSLSPEKIKLVVNRTSKNDQVSIPDIEKALDFPVFFQLPNSYAASVAAVNSGRLVVSVNHSALASSYTELAHRVSGIPQAKKRRFLGGLFS